MMKTITLKITLITIIAIAFNVKTVNAQDPQVHFNRNNRIIYTIWDKLVINSDNSPANTGALYFGRFSYGNKIEFTSSSFQFSNKIKVIESGVTVVLSTNTGSTSGWIGTDSNHGLYLGTNGNDGNITNMYLDTNDNVYIGGAQHTGIRQSLKNKIDLFVEQGILTEDLLISAKSQWSDYVFAEGYRLRPLAEVGEFIKKNKHLPNIPSQKIISEEGYSTHRMNVLFLEKIEELTLYILQQEERIKKLNEKVDRLTSINKQ